MANLLNANKIKSILTDKYNLVAFVVNHGEKGEYGVKLESLENLPPIVNYDVQRGEFEHGGVKVPVVLPQV